MLKAEINENLNYEAAHLPSKYNLEITGAFMNRGPKSGYTFIRYQIISD